MFFFTLWYFLLYHGLVAMGYKDGEVLRREDVWGTAEVTWPVHPGKEEAEGSPHCGLVSSWDGLEGQAQIYTL